MNDIAIKVATAFSEAGFQLFEVGGAIRDRIMGNTINDLDFATDAIPSVAMAHASKIGSVYPVGEEQGTIGVIVDGTKVEITTFRKEVYFANSRKPKVVFGTDLAADLARRDFTINALARNPLTDETIDLFGGKEDIKNGIVRCVGSDERLNEDPLRMMRAVRFACKLGFRLELEITNPSRLNIVSGERIRDELVKIILSDGAVDGLRMLCDYGLMEYIAPEFMVTKGMEQNEYHFKDVYEHSFLVFDKVCGLEDYVDEYDKLTVRVAGWLHDIGKPITKTESETGVHFYSHDSVGASVARIVLASLRFENAFIDRVCHLIRNHMTTIMYKEENLREKIILRLIRKIGVDNIHMMLDLVSCDVKSSNAPRHEFMEKMRKIVEECLIKKPEQMKSPLDGEEIMETFNLKAGKIIGEIKKALTDLVIDGVLEQDDKENAIVRVREMRQK